jgi:decaprenylphospho-beta-D-ribofuranose 2-oxidase
MAPEQGPPSGPRLFRGWGRTAPTWSEAVAVTEAAEVDKALAEPGPRGLIARGLGRAYGDAAQCAGGTVLELAGWSGIRALDLDEGVVTATAGTSLEQLMRWLVPLGWFVPVSPGTRHVTVGGAIAADIHGKNHHADGSFACHVDRVELGIPSGDVLTIGPDADADAFWATAGGMGLTGVVREATLRLQPIESSLLLVDTDRTPDLDSTMALMAENDERYRYSVAWIDLMARGASMGRSVLTQGRFALRSELPASAAGDPLAFDPKVLVSAPPWAPPHLLNRWSVRVLNEGWFRRAPRHREAELQTISTFFHPLDWIRDWNRMYGSTGFLQWQCLVPLGEEDTLRRIVHRLSDWRCPSFVTVLKRFGPADPGPLSFPAPGWTLTLDVAAAVRDLAPFLDELDREVADAGGRIYLAKDSRMRPDLMPEMYPRLDEWRAVRERLDPGRVLQSDLGRRLRL